MTLVVIVFKATLPPLGKISAVTEEIPEVRRTCQFKFAPQDPRVAPIYSSPKSKAPIFTSRVNTSTSPSHEAPGVVGVGCVVGQAGVARATTR